MADARKVTEELKKKGLKVDDIMEISNVVLIGGLYDPEGNRIQFSQEVSHQH